jgi:hypothetical protein
MYSKKIIAYMTCRDNVHSVSFIQTRMEKKDGSWYTKLVVCAEENKNKKKR